MNRKETAYVAKLESENRELRAQLDKHFEVYRTNLYEIVRLKSREETINRLLTELLNEVAM